MSELQSYYDAFKTGAWADPDPKKCLCRGFGWALSDVDTWHECPIHKGHRHPEDDRDEWEYAEDEARGEAELEIAGPPVAPDCDLPF